MIGRPLYIPSFARRETGEQKRRPVNYAKLKKISVKPKQTEKVNLVAKHLLSGSAVLDYLCKCIYRSYCCHNEVLQNISSSKVLIGVNEFKDVLKAYC